MTEKNARNELRIIAGTWRGRRLRFPPIAAIRPTPDRVRETLFNWLQGVIAGSRCLDLFAGSGALGLEALSRGAAKAVFVDRERAVTTQLRSILELLQATSGEVRHADARKFLSSAPQLFDVVFLDPPFGESLPPAAAERGQATRKTAERRMSDEKNAQQTGGNQMLEICRMLESGGWLASGAYIYIELPARAGAPALPPGWSLLKSGRAGEVGYHLARRTGAASVNGTAHAGEEAQ